MLGELCESFRFLWSRNAAFADILFLAREAITQKKRRQLPIARNQLFTMLIMLSKLVLQLEVNRFPPTVPRTLIIHVTLVRTGNLQDVGGSAHVAEPPTRPVHLHHMVSDLIRSANASRDVP